MSACWLRSLRCVTFSRIFFVALLFCCCVLFRRLNGVLFSMSARWLRSFRCVAFLPASPLRFFVVVVWNGGQWRACSFSSLEERCAFFNKRVLASLFSLRCLFSRILFVAFCWRAFSVACFLSLVLFLCCCACFCCGERRVACFFCFLSSLFLLFNTHGVVFSLYCG